MIVYTLQLQQNQIVRESPKAVIGYQGVSESLHWLRDKLRYGKKPTDVNGQPATNQHHAVGSETTWFWVYL